ncbi:Bug family tripartite tricarboxylate transporter substrate binding protein [Vineibacter terrae]|nr:tripartite tricarboxylate transporter substrate binding protein [Vineibacter terrae]
MKRRGLLAATAALPVLWAAPLRATPLPDTNLRVIFGYPPGGAGDFIARLVSEHAAKTLGRNVIVVNQPGATGLVAIDALRRAAPDGTTIAMVPMTGAVLLPMVNSRARFDFMTDVDPVAHCVSYSLGFAVAPNTGVKTWPDFLAWARANPTKLLYGGSGLGSISHLFGAMMKQVLGVDLQYVPFKGGAELNSAVMGGHVPLAIGVTSDFAEPHKAGRMQVLAVSSGQRDVSLPDVQTFVELGHKDLVSEPWFGFFAPPGTPEPLRAAWNGAINAALTDPAVRDRMIRTGFMVGGGSGEALRERMAGDKARWQPVVTASGVKMDG